MQSKVTRNSAALALVALFVFGTNISPAWALTRVATDKLMAAATKKPQPLYPLMARANQAQGQVEIEIKIGEDGKVKDARSISGVLLLRDAARAAAMQWEFDPQKLTDSPSEVIGVIVFNFKL